MKFGVINYTKIQVVADRHLREMSRPVSITSGFQVEEGCLAFILMLYR